MPTLTETTLALRLLLLCAAAGLFMRATATEATAADAELVGVLALAAEDSTIKELDLSKEQVEKLYDLLDSRDQAALAVASQVRGLSGEERAEKLRPLRVESQRLMAGILSDDQLKQLSTMAAAKPNPYYEPLSGNAPAANVEAEPAADEEPIDEDMMMEQFAREEAGGDPEPANDEATSEEPADPAAADQDAAPAEEQASTESGEAPADETMEEAPEDDYAEAPAKEGRDEDAGDEPAPSGRFGSSRFSRGDDEGGSSRFGRDSGSSSRFGRDDRESSSSRSGSSSVRSGSSREDFPKIDADGKLSFSFRYQPWQDVLDWFADQNGLSLLIESPPSGTFNYTDTRRYTPAEALDVINSVLLTKGYTLVRRDQMLVLVNLEDGVPPNLVTDVPLEELNQRGEFELIRVLFRVRNMTPEAASDEVSRLIGPQGKVVVLPRAGMLQITETAGRLRAIRDVIDAIESPESSKLGGIRPYDMQYASAAGVLPVLRQMLGIPEDAFSTPEGTLQIALDSTSPNRLLAYGNPEMIGRLEELLTIIDIPSAAGGQMAALQLNVYPISKADPDAALLVLQTILAEEPGTRLTIDPQTGSLVALASLANHATIRATLEQMQEDAREIAVIPLSTVDPQLAILSISKLFGLNKTGEEEPDPRAPIVDADLSTNSLLVRGSKAQIEQIRLLLNQMGESEDSAVAAAAVDRGNIRVVPLSSTEARTALEQLEAIWPSLRANPIRRVTPTTAIKSYSPSEQDSPEDQLERELDQLFRFGDPQDTPTSGSDRETRNSLKSKFMLAAFPQEEAASEPEVAAAAEDSVAESEPSDVQPVAPKSPSKPNAPILVAPGPSGLIIASDDIEALDAFERLLEASTLQNTTGGREYAVFYLKHAKANTAAAILGEIYGSSTSSSGDLMGGIVDSALGDIGGGLMGDLLGLGGTGSSSGFSAAGVDIVTDARLNAIIVYARPDDIDMAFRLLQVLDQRIGPTEIEAEGVPRLIPVVNTSATDIAEVVKQMYPGRIEGASGGQPSPEDLIRALRNNGGGGADSQEVSKMSIGVDTRSNSLIVKAEDALFFDVKRLVEELDTVQVDTSESTVVLSLRNSNPEMMKEALSSFLGSQAVTSTTQAPGQDANRGGNNNNGGDQARQQQEMIRRIQEFRQRMQGGGGGFPGGGGRGGGGRGGGGGGAPGGGGRGGGGRG
ncbi:secretin N-terminal domain-containing protein [Aeoliella mucimassa]|uniref:Bacterial type II/III secretion system short domain protein n=1 Tax=Aeoliella mucimassa TaxID=2527972 RepID=A0A518ATA1_9BACT|nr:secretin N-terminal domain-containing protein [Aeoliella mucimassa]QDU57964.1 Bacterial type II/III secretion system short domain protein [Aeoliella mucimassa]